MYLRENMFVAWTQIKSSKLRSVLTTMGITIGIATVICIVSILEGYNLSVTKELNMLGANVFQVEKYDRDAGIQVGHRGFEMRKDLKKEYAEEIREKCDAVKFVGAEVWYYNISFRYKDKKTNPSFYLAGGEPEFFENNSEPIGRGRGLLRSDVLSNARVAVIGQDIVDVLFPYEDPLGKFIKIAGTKFKVVGTIDRMGSTTFGQSRDNRAVIPITAFEDLFGSYRSVYLTVQSFDLEHLEEAKSQVIGVLRKLRKIPPGKENDFSLWSNDSLVESFENTAEKIQFGAILIGMISLLVGSIGVMNIMLVSVTERTKEIGTRKAVGAKRKTILFQFLNEAIFLSLIGGALGVFLGFLLAFILSASFNMPFAVPLWAVLSGLIVTSAVGLFAGIYPAAKASKLDPIEALRYE
jgi:putative ABC transport system permease protein